MLREKYLLKSLRSLDVVKTISLTPAVIHRKTTDARCSTACYRFNCAPQKSFLRFGNAQIRLLRSENQSKMRRNFASCGSQRPRSGSKVTTADGQEREE
jgi:hypothetical protein